MEKSNILRDPVKSSNVATVGYDAALKILSVEYKGGGVYHYHDVPESIGLNVKQSVSVGQYLHKNVKDKFKFSIHQ